MNDEAESTGTHALPPPRTPREARDSDPHVNRKGVSWRVVWAVLGAFCAALIPTMTIVMEAGELRQMVVDVRDEVSDLRRELRGVGERGQGTRERVVAVETRLDHVERDVAELKRARIAPPATALSPH